MRNRERHATQSTTNPDIASTTHELKAIHAQPAIIPPEANKDKTRRIGHAPLIALGGVVTAAVFGAGAYIGTRGGESSVAPDRTEPTQSAPAVPGETEVVSIETDDVTQKATPEQVAYVIANPVTISEYPLIEDQITALGERWNVMLNSGEVDWKNSSGDPSIPLVYTPETDEQLEAMLDSVYDPLNPDSRAGMMAEIRKSKDQHLAMFDLKSTAEVWTSWNATAVTTPVDGDPSVSIVNVNILNNSNQPDTTTKDGEYNDDLNVDFTLKQFDDGTVKIVALNNITDIGNVG